MKDVLYLIVDTSGSMSEMGKAHLQRNLCCYVSQLQIIDKKKYSDVELRFYQWGEKIIEIFLKSDGEIPVLTPEGQSDLVTLSNFLFGSLDERQKLKVLILSDGNFINSDISIFQKKLRKLTNLQLRTVAVGADADIFKLTKISSNDSVYRAENIASAIDSSIFGADLSVAVPESTEQILMVEPEEDWDV